MRGEIIILLSFLLFYVKVMKIFFRIVAFVFIQLQGGVQPNVVPSDMSSGI